MAITYSAGTGTVITSPIVYETLGSQTGAASNSLILATANVTPSTHTNYGGQVGDATTGTGPGDVYPGRLIVVRPGTATEEIKMITSVTDLGASIEIFVHEDWASQPASSDYVAVSYTFDDIETGGAGGGVAFTSKTNAFIFSNKLDIGNGTDFAMIQLGPAESMEINDSAGATDPDLEINNNGMFCSGYLFAGQAVNGGYITSDQNGDGEQTMAVYSGGYLRLFDADFKINLNDIKVYIQAGADAWMQGLKLYQFTYDAELLDGQFINMKWIGVLNGNDYVRIAEETTIDTWLLVSTDGFYTESGDTSAETLTLRDVIFINNSTLITVNSNKTWEVINPVWTVNTATQDDISFDTATGNAVNERYSVDVIVQEADGTPLQNALIAVYEHTQTQDLVVEIVSDSDGYATGSWIYIIYTDNSGTSLNTVTYGQHAFRVDKWLYQPFVATQTSNEQFDGVVVLNLDPYIVQTTQATALSEGAGIMWNDTTLLTTTTTTTTAP